MSKPVVYQVRGHSDCDPYSHVKKPVVSKPSCHSQLCIRSGATVTVVYPNHHVTGSCADRLQASGLDGIDPVLSCVFETTPVPLRPAAIWKWLLVFVRRNIHLPCVCVCQQECIWFRLNLTTFPTLISLSLSVLILIFVQVDA